MLFENPLIQGVFLKRYKRFFADVKIGDAVEIAHVANTGSMKSCNTPGQECLVSPASNPERKLKYTLEAIRAESRSWVGVNTARPNLLVKEAFLEKKFSHWKEFDLIRPEYKLNAETRLDFLFESSKTGKKHFVEVKNVTLATGDLNHKKGTAEFPDAKTERGQKHLLELMKLLKEGHGAEIFFCVQRTDCTHFAAAKEIDPEYARLLKEASKAGVTLTAATVEFNESKIEFTGELLKILI